MSGSASRLADWGWDLLGWVVLQLITVVSWGTARQRPVFLRWLSAPLWIPAAGIVVLLVVCALFDAHRQFPSRPETDPSSLDGAEGARVIPFRRPRSRS